MSFKRVLLILLLHQRGAFCLTNVSEFITEMVNYLQVSRINICRFYTSCWTRRDKTSVSETLQSENIYYTFLTEPSSFENVINRKTSNMIDLSCENAQSIDTKYLIGTLIFLGDDLEDLDIIKNLSLRSSEIMIFTQNYTQNIVRIGNRFISNEVTHNKSRYDQMKNMSDVTVRTGSSTTRDIQGDFESYMSDPRYKEHDSVSKYHFGVFKLLQMVHNFSYTNTLLKSTQSQNDLRLVELIVEDEIDLNIAGDLLSTTTLDKVAFLAPEFAVRPCFMFRYLKQSSIEFLRPFSYRTWYALFVISALLSIFLRVTFGANSIRQHSHVEENSLALSTFVVFSTLCQQGSSDLPSGIGSRLLFLSLLIMSLLLYNFYTSVMVSLLLSAQPKVYETLSDLSNSPFEIGTDPAPYTLDWFNSVTFSDVQTLYKTKIRSDKSGFNSFTPEDGVNRVRQGFFAYHVDAAFGYEVIGKNFNQSEVCDLREVQMIPPMTSGLTIGKHSHLREIFLISLRNLRQNGMIHRIKMIWKARKPDCYSTTDIQPMGMEQALGAFLCLIIGIALSVLFLILEIMWDFDIRHRSTL